MIIYLSMIAWMLLVGLFGRQHMELIDDIGTYELRSSRTQMFVAMFYIVFFIGLRSAGADTHAYISSFQNASTGWDAVFQALVGGFSETKAPGFDALEIAVKTIFGNNYHVWLFLLAFTSGMTVAKTLRKNTPYFIDAMLLFILMGTYGWMINGVRQFVAVSLSFAAINRLVQRKCITYILIILLLATIHVSVLVMIPIYFIVNGEAWNKKTLLLLFAGILAIVFTGYTTNLWNQVMVTAGYSVHEFDADDGSSFIRTLIYAVPPVIAFVYRKNIRIEATPLINVCINMSIVSVVLSLISNVTSGILVGRMPIYFSVYSLILLPWLIRHIPDKSLSKTVYVLMYILYFALWIIEGPGYYYSDLFFGGKVIL